MILEIAVVVLIFIYLLIWCVGFVEGVGFRRFVRKHHPVVAKEYFPVLLKGSIAQQFATMKWMWQRGYREIGDAGLNKRADFHRRIGFSTMALTLFIIFVLVAGRLWMNLLIG